jgi:hypothetical protein
MTSVENVVLYIDDAVRYDAAVDRLIQIGQTYKSIAASLHTPASFGSILTGRDVPRHGITGFGSRLPDGVLSLFDIDSHQVRLSDRGGLNESIASMYPAAETAPLEAMDPPFIWVIRGPGGHAPYNGYDMDTFEFSGEDARQYLHRLAGETEILREDYRRGVDSGIDEFERILATLRERGLAEDTLAIYTSDHGELLGEYGLLGHNHVACPELVYIPTTLVHPSLEAGDSDQTVRNVDILPTILQAIGSDALRREFDGKPINQLSSPIRGYNHYEQQFYTLPLVELSRTVMSIWDRNGGYSTVDSTRREAALTYLGVLLRSHCGKQIRRDKRFVNAFRRFMPGTGRYGSPGFEPEEADELIRRAQSGVHSASDEDVEVDQEQLRDLGYI